MGKEFYDHLNDLYQDKLCRNAETRKWFLLAAQELNKHLKVIHELANKAIASAEKLAKDSRKIKTNKNKKNLCCVQRKANEEMVVLIPETDKNGRRLIQLVKDVNDKYLEKRCKIMKNEQKCSDFSWPKLDAQTSKGDADSLPTAIIRYHDKVTFRS